MSYKSFLIVFEKSQIRIKNFEKIKRQLENNLEKFKAVDCINEYPKWREFALNNGYCSLEYINREVERVSTGKLGCNLSHQVLLENIFKKYGNLNDETNAKIKDVNSNKNPKWFLILEDDVGVRGTYLEINNFLETLIRDIEKENCKINNLEKTGKLEEQHKIQYVQLCIYNQFFAHQVKSTKLFGDTFKKIQQFGTCVYLIHIDAIEYLCKMRPWTQNIDFIYNSLDRQFNSVATFNPHFYCQGTTDAMDKGNQEYGSLIWNHSLYSK